MPISPPTHRQRISCSPVEQRRETDRLRGSARDRGYTARWDRASAAFKAEPDNVLCLGCAAVGWVTPSRVTDHIVPHRGDHDLMWDRGNWQPACEPHHDVVKQRLEQMHGQGQIGVDDLRLDSVIAQRLTLELLRR